MYGPAEYEIGRQHREEIRWEVAANRMETKLRASGGPEPGLLRHLGWELARYAGVFGKHLRNTAWRESAARAETRGGGRYQKLT